MEPYNDAAVAKIEERVDDHGRRLNVAEKRLAVLAGAFLTWPLTGGSV